MTPKLPESHNIDITDNKSQYSDKEINEIAEWAADLTLAQLFYLKASYEAFQAMEAQSHGNGQIH